MIRSSLNFNRDNCDESTLNNENIKILAVSGRIHINGNSGWIDFKSDGNCTGLGTFSEPYIIKDLVIDCNNSGNDGIIIENSNVYFIIENVTIINSGTKQFYITAGIKLLSISNGFLINNNLTNNHYGIYLSDSNYNTISGNTLYNHTNYGTNYGICLSYSNSNMISENVVNKSTSYGIRLQNSDNNRISDNIVNHNGNGISVFKSKITMISGNSVNNNSGTGIALSYSINNTISGNTADNHGSTGISIRHSNETTISENTANNNFFGIRLSDSNENMISKNNITNNVEIGIYLLESDNNRIIGNNLRYNKINIDENNCFGNIYRDNIVDRNPYSFILDPIIIGIIFSISVFLGAVVFFMYKKKVKNRAIQEEKR
ncbi:MAG: right-handed parallel beta-helix repeat-containing protein [Candidatus Hodarchaeales archaeon]|jgi:parallel beta-helix repeat protein